MPKAAILALLVIGCQAKPPALDDKNVEWPSWVATAYAPLDDAGVVVEESDDEIITSHDSGSMACAGSYSCRVGWRKTTTTRIPLWIECAVETAPSVWGCIHANQPRPRYRFLLSAEGRKWRADSSQPLTPWLDAVLESIRCEQDWQTFQICWGEVKFDRYEAIVLGWFNGDEDWSHREVTAIKGQDECWRATFERSPR